MYYFGYTPHRSVNGQVRVKICGCGGVWHLLRLTEMGGAAG
jgi:hypothetical protein